MPTAIPATTSISSWNRATKHVEADVRSGRYVNAETCLLFAGPPRITDIGGIDGNTSSGTQNAALVANGIDALYPIGLVEQFGLQQVQTVQKMFEIGSRRSYQAGGRVHVAANLGRVMFHGPSLLRVCYAYYPNSIALANGKSLNGGSGTGSGGVTDSVSAVMVGGNMGSSPANGPIFPQIFFEAGSLAGTDPEETLPDTFFINLMSELFSNPFGLGCILRDNRNNNYGGFYLEDSMITAHSLQISSSSTLITEALNIQCDAAVPMEFSTDSGAPISQN